MHYDFFSQVKDMVALCHKNQSMDGEFKVACQDYLKKARALSNSALFFLTCNHGYSSCKCAYSPPTAVLQSVQSETADALMGAGCF